MFKSTTPGRHTNEWAFVVENAKLEAIMLAEDITIKELAVKARVSFLTMKAFLETGVRNKAYRNLMLYCPGLMEEAMK